ncbi:MAG: hypothetical protein IPM38_10060 [Ignavibacteria bacterium]|nr:hypothetical protein [Ignavibacteria bacterium]
MFKIFFEMGHYENALSVLNSMRQYVSSTKDLSDLFKIRYMNFVKYSKELLKIKLSDNPNATGLLKNKIENEDHIFSREWFIKKLGS